MIRKKVITIRLDSDVLAWIKESAAKDKMRYQTWLNLYLGNYIEAVEMERATGRIAGSLERIAELLREVDYMPVASAPEAD